MKIYGDHRSGNCYKIALTASLLGLALDWNDVDIMQGETQTDDFKALNPLGKIPLLEMPDGQCLSESNAIINFIAHGSALLPTDPWQLARVQQWQFFEQYSHEPFIAVARFINKFQGLPEHRKAEYVAKQSGGHQALKVMELQLCETDYLANNQFSVADISLYAYTHVAADGGFDLSLYPAVVKWLDRISRKTLYVPMAGS